MVTRYYKRISGPLLDRIDNHSEVPRVEYERLSEDRPAPQFGAPVAHVHAEGRVCPALVFWHWLWVVFLGRREVGLVWRR